MGGGRAKGDLGGVPGTFCTIHRLTHHSHRFTHLLCVCVDVCARETLCVCMFPVQEFPSVQPTFEQFIQLLPPLTPRWYTIASSSVAHPNTVHLAVSEVFVVRAPLRRVHVCVHA